MRRRDVELIGALHSGVNAPAERVGGPVGGLEELDAVPGIYLPADGGKAARAARKPPQGARCGAPQRTYMSPAAVTCRLAWAAVGFPTGSRCRSFGTGSAAMA